MAPMGNLRDTIRAKRYARILVKIGGKPRVMENGIKSLSLFVLAHMDPMGNLRDTIRANKYLVQNVVQNLERKYMLRIFLCKISCKNTGCATCCRKPRAKIVALAFLVQNPVQKLWFWHFSCKTPCKNGGFGISRAKNLVQKSWDPVQ